LWIGAINISWRSYRYFSVFGLVLSISIGEAIDIFLLWIGAIDIFCCRLWIGAIDISWRSYWMYQKKKVIDKS
jgi:hypothetical protein